MAILENEVGSFPPDLEQYRTDGERFQRDLATKRLSVGTERRAGGYVRTNAWVLGNGFRHRSRDVIRHNGRMGTMPDPIEDEMVGRDFLWNGSGRTFNSGLVVVMDPRAISRKRVMGDRRQGDDPEAEDCNEPPQTGSGFQEAKPGSPGRRARARTPGFDCNSTNMAMLLDWPRL